MSDNFLLGLIVICEVAFWLVLLAGLSARYLLSRRRLGSILLACVPVVDLILFTATVLDLHRGATVTFAHGLAAAYIGFTVAFGPMTVRWADSKFAHKFVGAESPPLPPSWGWARVRYDLMLWGRCLLAAAIMCLLVAVAIILVDDRNRTLELEEWFGAAVVVSAVWFIFGPLWSLAFVWRKPKA